MQNPEQAEARKTYRAQQLALRNAKRAISKNLRDMLEKILETHSDQLLEHAQAGRGIRIHLMVLNPDGSEWDPEPEEIKRPPLIISP